MSRFSFFTVIYTFGVNALHQTHIFHHNAGLAQDDIIRSLEKYSVLLCVYVGLRKLHIVRLLILVEDIFS